MPAAIGAIFTSDRKKILLIKRRDVPVWVLPGGGIESGESPEEAVARELLEETGVTVTVKRKIAEYIPINRLTSFSYFFECEHSSGEPQPTDESIDAAYFPVDQLPESFFMIHRQFLEDALANHPFTIQKLLDQVTYFELAKYLCRHPLQVLRFGLSRLGLPINN